MRNLPPEHEDFGFYMSKIVKRRTGLEYDLWCDCLGRLRDKDIRPYVMIQSNFVDGEWLVIDIVEDVVKEGNCIYFPNYKSVISYVKKNKKAFMKHWNGEFDDLDLVQNLRCARKGRGKS